MTGFRNTTFEVRDGGGNVLASGSVPNFSVEDQVAWLNAKREKHAGVEVVQTTEDGFELACFGVET